MARLPRYTIINQPQHIIQLGRNGQKVFFEDQDFEYFRDCLDAAAYNYRLKVHAYALMPDHVHILASPGNPDSISRTVQSVGRNYVQYFNECYGGSGTLWEGRYRATVVDSKTYLLLCSRYIESNPVRSALTDKPANYRWTSYPHNAMGEVDDLVTAHKEYLNLGTTDKARAKAYRGLFKHKINVAIAEEITNATLKGWALGDAKFARKIEKLSGRRALQLPKGRPKGS